MKNYKTTDAHETETLGETLSAALRPGDVVAFTGGLGAGKTVMARGILRGLGYGGPVTSPTFSILNEYRGGRLDVVHADLYRLGSEDALYATGFYDYLDGRFVVLVEWSENAPWAIEPGAVTVHITGSGDAPREIRIGGREL